MHETEKPLCSIGMTSVARLIAKKKTAGSASALPTVLADDRSNFNARRTVTR